MNNPSDILRNHNLYIIFAITLMGIMGVASIAPAFPVIVKEFQLQGKQIAMLITVFTVPGVFLSPMLGIMADRLGRKKVLVPSLVLFSLAGTSCTLANNYDTLLILRFFQGIGASAIGSLNSTLIGDIFSGPGRGKAMGYNASVLSMGTASYPFIGGALATVSWHYPFYLPALALPVAFLVLFGLTNPEPEKGLSMSRYFKNALDSMREKTVIAAFLISLLTFMILYGSYLTYLPLLADQEYGYSPLIIGLLMSTMSVTTAFTASLSNTIRQRIGLRNLLIISYVSYIISLQLFLFATHLFLLILAILFFGLAQGSNIPTIQTLLAALAPHQYRGVFMAINGTILRLGQTIGPLFAALMFGLGGYTLVFGTTAIMAIIMIFIAVFMIGRSEIPN